MQSPALDTYFSELLGEQRFKVVVYRDASKAAAGPLAMPVDGFANPGNEPFALSGTIFVSAKLLADSDEMMLAQKIAHALARVSLRHATKLNTKMQIARFAQTPIAFMGDAQVTQHIPLGFKSSRSSTNPKPTRLLPASLRLCISTPRHSRPPKPPCDKSELLSAVKSGQLLVKRP